MLVPSAWLGAWQWESVSQELEKNGYNVIANELPGHGKDTTSANEITMDNSVYDNYSRAICFNQAYL